MKTTFTVTGCFSKKDMVALRELQNRLNPNRFIYAWEPVPIVLDIGAWRKDKRYVACRKRLAKLVSTEAYEKSMLFNAKDFYENPRRVKSKTKHHDKD